MSQGPELRARNKDFVALRGVARQVVQANAAEGAGRSAGAFLEVRFNLAGWSVVTRFLGKFLDIKEGHDVIVAGFVRGDELWPVAWWNCSKENGYSPRTWEFWPCLLGLGLLLGWLGWHAIHAAVTSAMLFRAVMPGLLLAVLAWSAHRRRKAARVVQEMRSGKLPEV